MKYISLLTLFVLAVGYCLWVGSKEWSQPRGGMLWNDTLKNHIPKYVDTSIIVKDANGTELHFHQYIKAIFNNEAMIYPDRGVWRLQRFSKGGMDSLNRNINVVARMERWAVRRTPDTLQSLENKFKAIARSLSFADHILVLKSKRKMFVKRKGVDVLTFNIQLGRVPVGHKHFDGDGRTPEGIYYLDNKYVRRDKYHKSFWISYPNDDDREYAAKKGLKPGMGVMIHGTTNARTNSKDWTNGCIALKNDDMDSLFNHVMAGTSIEIRQ